MHKIKDKRALLYLYDTILPALAAALHAELAGITPLFHNFILERVVDTWTKDPDAHDDTPIGLEQGNVQYLLLRLQLDGFQRAGLATFDLRKELLFILQPGCYTLGPQINRIWMEKEYGQSWTEPEKRKLAQRWCAELIDEIKMRLELLV